MIPSVIVVVALLTGAATGLTAQGPVAIRNVTVIPMTKGSILKHLREMRKPGCD